MVDTPKASVLSRTSPLGRLLTISEAAETLAVSRATVYRLLDENELPRIRVRSHTRVAEADLAALIERRRAQSAPVGGHG